jgi:hypothetical protein
MSRRRRFLTACCSRLVADMRNVLLGNSGSQAEAADKRLAMMNRGRRKRVKDDEPDHASAVMQE